MAESNSAAFIYVRDGFVNQEISWTVEVPYPGTDVVEGEECKGLVIGVHGSSWVVLMPGGGTETVAIDKATFTDMESVLNALHAREETASTREWLEQLGLG